MNTLASSTPRFQRFLANMFSALAILAIALANTGSVAQAVDVPVDGFHDGASGTVDAGNCVANGWAVDPADPETRLNVRVLSDGNPEPVATGIASDYGEDLLGPTACTDGFCRFTISLWGLITPHQQHLITVQAQDPDTGEWQDLKNTPRYLTCSPVLSSLRVSVSEDYFRGDNFAPNTPLTFNAYASPDPGAELLWSTTGTTDQNGYVFLPRQQDTPDLIVGNYVVATNGSEQKDLVLEDVTIDSFDTFTDVVTGTAPKDRFVWVWGGNDVGPGCAMGAVADDDGRWTADFKTLEEPCELQPWYWGAVELADPDWDLTVYEKGADPAMLTVNTTDDHDDGACTPEDCSLREAINFSNIHNAQDTIAFNIPGEGPFTIQPQSALPEILRPVVLDGTTQPDFEGTPIVELDGSNAVDGMDGLVISAGDSTVRGLVVNRWQNVGILLQGSYETGTGGNLIEGNYLGTDITGSSAAGNNIGVYAFLSSGNTIRGNLLSGNMGAGVGVRGFAHDNVISGNRIGTSADGLSAVPNTIGVVLEESATSTTVGGTSEDDRNLISGNDQDGVWIKDLDTNDNVVQGNYIGTDATGAAALPNGSRGLYLSGAVKDNLIAGNVISGNGAAGIRINDPDTTGNKLQGNYIGTDSTGTLRLANGYVGVRIAGGASGNIIGGIGAGNLISGNAADGVLIDEGSSGNQVQYNYIGVDSTGENALGNFGTGIFIAGGASGNVIGGPDAGNVISGNGASGVQIEGEGTSGNFVQGNLIGTNKSGTSVFSAKAPPQVHYGVSVDLACPTYPPGTDFDGFVSASDDPLGPWSGTSVTFKGWEGEDGCPISESNGSAQLIYRYRIAFDDVTELESIAVTGAAFNGPDNILRVLDADRNELATAGTNGGNSYRTNYIFLHGVSGQVFFLEEYDTSSTWRYRESIVVNGPLPLFNGGSGVFLLSSTTNNMIGGADAAARNIISGNYGSGIGIFDPGTTGNIVQGNYVGTDISGTQILGQGGYGVEIGNGAPDNLIGGPNDGDGNLVSGNGGDGIVLWGEGTAGNTVQGNTVGSDAGGSTALPNRGVGIWIGDSATDAHVASNLISGNAGDGISVNGMEATDMVVENNVVGTDRGGVNPLPNRGQGIFTSAPGGQILNNLVSANRGHGILLGETASGNTVKGNLVGTDLTGTTTLSAAAPGLGDYTVEAMSETCPTYDAGTDFDGFVSQSAELEAPWSGTSVMFKGTDECTDRPQNGAASLIYRYQISLQEPTKLYSLAVTGAAFNGPDNVLRVLDENMNVVGESGTTAGNNEWTNYVLLPGVEGTVFYVEEYDTSSAWRYRESIVLNGPMPLGNLYSGVVMEGGASDNQIGGAEDGARNILSGNLGSGVGIYNPGTSGNRVQGNYIGTDINGTHALGQSYSGIDISGEAQDNLIGGTGAGEGNLISGNAGDGISIYGPADNNVVQGNTVGADATGSVALGNFGNGIWLGDAVNTLIGGTDEGAGNLFSGNGIGGLSLNGLESTGTIVQGNLIGTDRAGTTAIPNRWQGIWLTTTQTTIGGTAPRAGNLISGNGSFAIELAVDENGGAAFGNTIQGNRIGTTLDGTGALPNGSGIFFNGGVHDNLVGGTDDGAGNVIAYNGWTGIATAPDAGLSNAFLSNSIFSNGALGIDLSGDGVTLNDPRDLDTGPNNLQNFPVLNRVIMAGGNLVAVGTLSSAPSTTYRVEFFSVPECDPSGYGEGQTFLGFKNVTTNRLGIAIFSFVLPQAFSRSGAVTSTATDPAGNTSEFSKCAGPGR